MAQQIKTHTEQGSSLQMLDILIELAVKMPG
jgi:hypothetical protein